jgi:hypothetical protein
MDRDEIERLLATPDDELFRQLGVKCTPRSLQGGPLNPAAYVAAGKQWLTEQRHALCILLGQSPLIRGFVSGKRVGDRVELVAAAADVIVGMRHGVPVLVVSTLVVKVGFVELCGERCFVGD